MCQPPTIPRSLAPWLRYGDSGACTALSWSHTSTGTGMLPSPPMPTVTEIGRCVLRDAHLPQEIDATCAEALTKPGRLFSPVPAWSRLFLAWLHALADPPYEEFLPAAVACEAVVTGYDLIDDVYDRACDAFPRADLTDVLPSGVTLLLLAQEVLARLDVPADRRARACAVLARASRRVFAAQGQDYVLRDMPPATQDVVFAVLRRRSGTLAAAPCQCAAVLADSPWRVVALAGRFGRLLGCAAQLEDDLADRVMDEQSGRQTIPTVLAHFYPATPELVEATTWVLLRHFLEEAARVLRRLPPHVRTESLWTLLPTDVRADSLS